LARKICGKEEFSHIFARLSVKYGEQSRTHISIRRYKLIKIGETSENFARVSIYKQSSKSGKENRSCFCMETTPEKTDGAQRRSTRGQHPGKLFTYPSGEEP
jgi:hypothetical protein